MSRGSIRKARRAADVATNLLNQEDAEYIADALKTAPHADSEVTEYAKARVRSAKERKKRGGLTHDRVQDLGSGEQN